jgi:hypothetical protein
MVLTVLVSFCFAKEAISLVKRLIDWSVDRWVMVGSLEEGGTI